MTLNAARVIEIVDLRAEISAASLFTALRGLLSAALVKVVVLILALPI